MLKNINPRNRLHKEILKICHSMKLNEHNYVKGSKLYNNYQRIAVIILYFRSGKSLRRFCEEFGETKWPHWFQMRKLPKKSTLHDWLKSFSLTFIRQLLQYTLDLSKPSLLGIDGSGIDAEYKSSYYRKRIGLNSQLPWHKLDIICDLENSKQIIDFSFLLKDRHDARVAKQLFKRLKLTNIKLIGDKAYYSFNLYRIMNSKSNHLIVPPKNYGNKCRHRNTIRNKFQDLYYQNEEKYSKRNNVEGVFSSMKRVEGLRVRSSISYMKKREIGWNIVWYNIRKKISYLICFNDILRFYMRSI